MESLLTVQQYAQAAAQRVLPSSAVPRASCSLCARVTSRLFVCLHCQHVGCCELAHAAQHAADSAHWLGVELSANRLYCFACHDVVYDADCAAVAELQRVLALARVARTPSSAAATAAAGGAANVVAPWWPTPTQAELLRVHAQRVATPPSWRALRGLNNLGNTCFMSSILQALVHNPLLRNFFASDQHNRKLCLHRRWLIRSRAAAAAAALATVPPDAAPALAQRADASAAAAMAAVSAAAAPGATVAIAPNSGAYVERGAGVASGVSEETMAAEICLGCEFDYFVSEMLSGVQSPFSPHQFLYSVWKHSNTFAGYEQQDAHEFLMCVLDGIHASCGGTRVADCRCVVHSIFAGVLRSDVTCRRCGATSTANDPFIDISLELPRTTAVAAAPAKPHGSAAQLFTSDDDPDSGGVGGGGGSSGAGVPFNLSSSAFVIEHPYNNGERPSVSLDECLQRFTRPEKLGRTERTFCNTCQDLCESVKQLSMKRLPAVICFHLKRFEQGPTLKNSHKIDTHVSFPDVLDMAPYVTDEVVRTRLDRKRSYDSLAHSRLEAERRGDAAEDGAELYELFAVVNHTGKIDNGHYTCAVRHDDNKWIKCDDAALTLTTFDEVAESEAYLLFYAKTHLAHGD
jgi:ubiquitin carboxyl-terminal hydrolase 22/27/51